MSIRITKANALVTVQDIGRFKFQSSGVPVSGPMDEMALNHANLLIGNKRHDACLEVGMGYLEMIIDKGTLISICGDGHHVFINDVAVSQDRPILFREEGIVKLKPGSGLWSYIAIGSGINCPEILGSKSTYLQAGFGGVEGRALKAGDEIKSYETVSPLTVNIIKSLSRVHNDFATVNWFAGKNFFANALIRIMPGPEWNWLSIIQQEKILSQSFTISNDSNKMGYRLEGKSMARQNKNELISSGVTKGTIQLTNDGSLIVLMADSQTVGGYPRIAQVAIVDIPKLSQQKPGTEIRFDLISHEEGERLFLECDLDLQKLETGIRLKVL